MRLQELFHVLEREIILLFRDEVVVVRAGQSVNVPALAPHRFSNRSGARPGCSAS